ncbi:Fe-S cluster assembly sulfur transfer protein SufU [Streptomonospora salina]|uniref:Nitrogen fixation NifU-like protein n=2 Tax=Streptomonospora salina TaxID=104205 RepID=A0A841ECV8_9ACTN|nr:SUF system NifU family Fe-S cluster assembly protein [Streptomonospora salina]MBB6000826.1 nitrogen fixation NifU-like protein [Streptomonospora salina]
MQLDSMYQEIILDHYRNPHNKGLREPHNGEAHHVNPTCGDEVTVRVRLTPAAEGGALDGEATIADVSYESMGCSISQASASVATDLLIGHTLDEGMRMLDAFTELMHSKGRVDPDEDVLQDAVAFAGVSKYPARIKCALLAWMAFKDATAQSLETEKEGAS